MNTYLRVSLKLVLAGTLIALLQLLAKTSVDFVYTGF
jgi:hypothetical protein